MSVFEGILPADVGKNPLLNDLLKKDGVARGPQGRLRLAGRCDRPIKDPTSVVFRPQSGSNVLIVGQTTRQRWR